MNRLHGSDRPAGAASEREASPAVTDAPADVGDVSDLAEAERLEDDRMRREAERAPDLPDRAFDRITPQV